MKNSGSTVKAKHPDKKSRPLTNAEFVELVEHIRADPVGMRTVADMDVWLEDVKCKLEQEGCYKKVKIKGANETKKTKQRSVKPC